MSIELINNEAAQITIAPSEGTELGEASNEEVVECVGCNATVLLADTHLFEGDPYCTDCTTSCDDCETIMPRGELNDRLCEQCLENYSSCYDCGDRTHDDHLTTVDGEYICDTCLDNGYRFCESCDRYEPENDRCVGSSGLIEDYSYKPSPEFYRTEDELADPSRPFFGVELETEVVNGDIDEGAELVISSLGELVYLKHDGSLNHGFEIVTHPMTLRFAQAQDWGVFAALAKVGFRSWQTETCGIHVHVSRSGFKGKAHIWRFAHLLYRNPAECQCFAGRTSSYWSSFDDQRGAVAKVLKRETPPTRYVAVNLCNEETIEVRMFRASLKGERLLADIEFVAAALEYTRRLTVPEVNADALAWSAFRSYVDDNAATYPHLVALLIKGGI